MIHTINQKPLAVKSLVNNILLLNLARLTKLEITVIIANSLYKSSAYNLKVLTIQYLFNKLHVDSKEIGEQLT